MRVKNNIIKISLGIIIFVSCLYTLSYSKNMSTNYEEEWPKIVNAYRNDKLDLKKLSDDELEYIIEAGNFMKTSLEGQGALTKEDEKWIKAIQSAVKEEKKDRNVAKEEEEDKNKTEEEKEEEQKKKQEYDLREIFKYLDKYGIYGLDEETKEIWRKKIKEDKHEDPKKKEEFLAILDGKSREEANEEVNGKPYEREEQLTIYKYPSKADTTVSNSEQSLEDMMSDANDFINKGAVNIDQGTLSNFSKTMYNILLAVGVVVAVIIGAIIGLKLMTSSIEEKAEAKKLLVPYVVGCVMVFGGFAIWKLVVTILQSI